MRAGGEKRRGRGRGKQMINFRTIRAPLREGRRETRGGRERQGGARRRDLPPAHPLVNKNQIHYGLR